MTQLIANLAAVYRKKAALAVTTGSAGSIIRHVGRQPVNVIRSHRRIRLSGTADAAALFATINSPMPQSPSILLDHDTTDEMERQRAAAAQKLKDEIHAELDQRQGRGWTDPWNLRDTLDSKIDFAGLQEWKPSLVSRVSQERLVLHPTMIPTLVQLAELPLPAPAVALPDRQHAKVFALQRQRAHAQYVSRKVTALAAPRVASIRALDDWNDQQDAVDELFENIELELQASETILGLHPKFGIWVERALEQYLQGLQSNKVDDSAPPLGLDDGVKLPTTKPKMGQSDDDAVPVFMDCFDAKRDDKGKDSTVVPAILRPLAPTERGINTARMHEEWALAAHKTAKRIMLRRHMRMVAAAITGEKEKRQHVLLHGVRGIGKTATLAALVASARRSGHVVLYLPDGDRLCKQGYFVEPNPHRPGMYDLPVLSQQVCEHMLASHQQQLASLSADRESLSEFFTKDQLAKIPQVDKGSITLADLLQHGVERSATAPMAYSAVIDALMKQDHVPFMFVVDEVNCYFGPGHYFHESYDVNVRQAIPMRQLTLFRPFLEALGLSSDKADNGATAHFTKTHCTVVAATTETRGIARSVTDTLVQNAKAHMAVVEVPRLSPLETRHMLSHYEAIGLGRLRLDRGATVMNEQEVEYLHMLSDGIPQQLMDACIV